MMLAQILLLLCLFPCPLSLTCSEDENHVEIHRIYGLYAELERMVMYNGPLSTDQLIYTEMGAGKSYRETVHTLCLSSGVSYAIYLTSETKTGWHSSSSFYILVNGVDYLRGSLIQKYEEQRILYISYAIRETQDWYTTNSAQNTTNWRKTEPTTWGQALTPGHFENITSMTTTRYYSRKIMYTDRTCPTFEIAVYSRFGFVVFVDGVEVLRHYLRNADVDSDTPPTQEDASPSWKRVYLSTPLHLTLKFAFVLGVEVHTGGRAINEKDEFKVISRLHENSLQISSSRVFDVDIKSFPEPSHHDSYDHLIDASTETTFAVASNRCNITLSFKNHRNELVNSYSIRSARNRPGSDPSSWSLYGATNTDDKNEEMTIWHLVDYREKEFFDDRNTVKTFSLGSLVVPFSSFRLVIESISDESSTLQIGQFDLQLSGSTSNGRKLSYLLNRPPILIGIDTYFHFRPLQAGLNTYKCLDALPPWISIDSRNGAISGTVPQTGQSSGKEYRIQAIQVGTSAVVEGYVSITISKCNQTESSVVLLRYINKPGNSHDSFALVSGFSTVTEIPGTNKVETVESVFCVSRTAAGQLKLKTTNRNAWTPYTHVEVELILHPHKSIKVGRFSLNGANQKSFPIPFTYVIPDAAANVYSIYSSESVTEPPIDWFSASSSSMTTGWTTFDTTNWESASSVHRKVWFIRRSFSLSAVAAAVQSYEMQFFCRQGVVVYINGNEKYRLNVESGPVTSTSEITGGSSISSWHTLTGLKSDFQTGDNLIAYAIVNTNAELLIDFNVVLMLNTGSHVVSRSFDVTASGMNVHPGYVASNLVDNQVQTMSVIDRLTSDAAGVYDLKFKNNRYELINYYCFTSNSEFPHHDPIDWDIFGSNDGTGDHSDVNSEWVHLKNDTMNEWNRHGRRACFYIPGNTNAFNIYRFVLNENSYQLPTNAFALAEIELFTISFPDVEESITFQPSTQQSYANGRMIPVIPTQSYYRQCRISPELPKGVALSTYDGIVNGVPLVTMSLTTFTVTCTTPENHVRSGSFSLEVIACDEDNGSDLFSIVYPNTQGQGELMKYTLSSGSTPIASRTALPNYHSHELSVCMLTNSSVTMSFSGNNGVNHASIHLSDNMEYFGVGTDGMKAVEIKSISPFMLIKNHASWYYLHEGEVSDDWNTKVPTNWEYNSTIHMPVPTSSSITQYFVKGFQLNGRTVTAEVEYSIRVKAGAIVYLNGIVIAQINMPGDSVTNETLATAEYSMPRTFYGSFRTMGVIVSDNNVNVLAVEMHRKHVIPTTSTFQMTLMFVHESIPRQYRGIASARDMESEESYLNAFDNNPMTVYRSEKSCRSQFLRYDFAEGSKYFINGYELVVDEMCRSVLPNTWIVEGSEDGEYWVTLDAHLDLEAPSTTRVKVEFNNPSAYSSYRIRFLSCARDYEVISSCPSEGIQIKDWNLFSKKPSKLGECATTEGYPAAFAGLYSYRSCNAMYSGFTRRKCLDNGSFDAVEDYCQQSIPSSFSYPHVEYEFLINHSLTTTILPTVICAACTFSSHPPLPQGLLLNESTGEMIGVPTEAASGEYVITAMNVAGETTITLSITTGEGPMHCPTDALSGWERSIAGQNATKPCPTGYAGVMTRFCRDGSPAVWESESNECYATQITVVYPNVTFDFVKHVQISTIIPTITGVEIISRKISPTLPSGLYFDPSSGIISGKPTVKMSTTEYTVSIQNSFTTTTASFTITITSLWCNADGDWGQTDSGDTYFKNCPANKEGTWSRMCSTEQPPYWKTVVDACVYIMPTLTYAKSAYQLQRGMSVNIVPTKGYYITSITYSGTLPSGLSFNNGDGSITGNPPSLADASTLTIIVRNPDKVNVVYLSLSVVSVKCTSDGTWPMTEAGQTAQLSCAALKEGMLYRECTLSGDQGVWAAVTGACTFMKPVVNYPRTSMMFVKGKSSYFRPNVENQIDSFSISPTLPEGLSISSQNGEISGIAKGPKGIGNYSVRASNVDTFVEVEVSVGVFVYSCEADATFKETEQATTGYAWCKDGKVGVISRPCNKGESESVSVWGTADASMCMSDPTKMRPSEGRLYNRFTVVISGITKATFTEIEYAELTNIFVAGTESVKSELFIESYTEGDVVIAAAGMQLQTRIETQEANADAKKLKVKEFFSGSACTNKLKESQIKSLNQGKCSLVGEVSIVKPAVNALLIVLITIVTLFLVIFIVLVMYYVYVRSKSKTSKRGHMNNYPTRNRKNSQSVYDVEPDRRHPEPWKVRRTEAVSGTDDGNVWRKLFYKRDMELQENVVYEKKMESNRRVSRK